jgi:AcrR family transcriptional regulator
MTNREAAAIKMLRRRAEALFAEREFFGVSVRDITEHAGVRLASVDYYFGTKETLFREVVARRAAVVSEDRRGLLAKIGGASVGKEERTRRLASAFILPLLQRALRQGAGWKNYCRFIAQVANSRLWASDVIAPNYDEIGKDFVRALSDIFPQSTPYNVQYAYQFLVGTTLYVLTENGRIETKSNGRYRSDDLERIYGVLLEFVTAGMVRLCKAKASGAKARPRRPSGI